MSEMHVKSLYHAKTFAGTDASRLAPAHLHPHLHLLHRALIHLLTSPQPALYAASLTSSPLELYLQDHITSSLP